MIPSQVNPSPEYPSLHSHEKLPMVFVQIAWVWHPPLFVEHSLISFSQNSPLYPIPKQSQYAAFVSVLSIHTPLLAQSNLSHPIEFFRGEWKRRKKETKKELKKKKRKKKGRKYQQYQ